MATKNPAAIALSFLLAFSLASCGETSQQSRANAQYEQSAPVTDLKGARAVCSDLERRVEQGSRELEEYLNCIERVLHATSDRNTGSPQVQYRESDDWFEMYWKFQFYNALLGNAGIGYAPRYGYMGSPTLVVPARVVNRVSVPRAVVVGGKTRSTASTRTNFDVGKASRNYNGMATAHRAGKTNLQYGSTAVRPAPSGRALSNTRSNTARQAGTPATQAAPKPQTRSAAPVGSPSVRPAPSKAPSPIKVAPRAVTPRPSAPMRSAPMRSAPMRSYGGRSR